MYAELLIFLFKLYTFVNLQKTDSFLFYFMLQQRCYFLDIALDEIYLLHYSSHRSVHISCVIVAANLPQNNSFCLISAIIKSENVV